MSKWRDVKQNRIKKKNIESIKNSSKDDLASIPSRLKAFLTDTFLITTPIIYIVMYIILGGREDFANNMILGWALIFGPIAFIITFLWYVKFQTPGMKAYSIRIVNRNHKRISFLQAVIRFGATLFAIASLFLLFIPFFNKDKKTFQDILSNTIIINDK